MKVPVDALSRLERAVSQEKGPFSLFGLFLRDESPARWDLVASAPWIERDRGAALEWLADQVQSALSVEEITSISRIVLVDPFDPSVTAINRTVRVEHDAVELRDAEFFGHHMRRAHIIASARQAPQLRQRTPRYKSRRPQRRQKAPPEPG